MNPIKETEKQPSGTNKDDAFGDMSSMFKDFERIAKESADKGGEKTGDGGSNSGGDPFAKLMAGMMGGGGEGGPEIDDKQMMDMFKGLMGNLGDEKGSNPDCMPNEN